MDRSAPISGLTFSDNKFSGDSKRKDTFLSRCTEIYESKYWKPPALRAPVLILTIAICWSLIAVLEYLLWKSEHDNGLIFAPTISALPLRDTFLYLYFPTIVAVVFSIYWAWIDLETKRMEPYYQLSKENGALGKDSLLLHYPFSFIPLAPIRALRDRHWSVFWASFAVILVTWGLVPMQAGIFSVRAVTRTTNITFAVSTSSMPFEKQATSLTFRYMQSTYGIATLNETLPPFMTRNYTLAQFEPSVSALDDLAGQGTYTAPTTMYQLDLACENASHKANSSQEIFYTSSSGCNATVTLGLNGNETIGDSAFHSSVLTVKKYIGKYVGYHSGGSADYYLSPYCPLTANTTFLAAFTKSKEREQDPPQDVTAIYCQPQYWRQEVFATIDKLTKRPLEVKPIGEKQVLPWYVFNTTNFEALLNSGTLGAYVRGDVLPTMNIPRYLETVAGTELSLQSDGIVQPMVGLALGTSGLPMENFLDWKVLSRAYTDAYQLMFARAMVEILGPNTGSLKYTTGQKQIRGEAVVLEPVFVHIVVGFLGLVSLATIALLVLSLTRKRNLRTDPSTIASIMSIVADNQTLLADFADLDCCTMEDVEKILAQKRYKLINNDDGTSLVEITHGTVLDHENQIISTLAQHRRSPTSIAEPVRPMEFSLWMAFLFIALFVTLLIALGVIFNKAHVNGLPLPSTNVIVQNLLENYIPTAIATLIEPMWILINRLLCMLQPLEELQGCNARAKKSIDMNYSSLPPQLVVFKALKSRHFVLAAVCAMALLSNLLAIAFSGLFNQESVEIRHATSFQPPYEHKLVSINGSIGPEEGTTFGSGEASGAYQGGNGEDQFLVAESNFTRNTPLPSWTDDSFFYLPVFPENISTLQTNAEFFEATTNALGAELECTQLKIGDSFKAAVTNVASNSIDISMNVTVPWKTGNVQCGTTRSVNVGAVSYGPLGPEFTCVGGPSANEIVSMLQPRENATQSEQEACMGRVIFSWMRHPQGSCELSNNTRLDEKSSLFVHCQPKMVTARAKIQIDASGRLHRPAEIIGRSQNAPQSLFSNDAFNVIGQSNLYLFRYAGSRFQNDSFASDYFNYFIKRETNSSRLLDPNRPVPTFNEAVQPLNKVYSKLFAIWLGINKKNLFVPTIVEERAPTHGYRVQSEQRVFVSTTMFIIAEAILCTYVLVAIWVYARRPGRYLARLPISIASVIALFAASTVIEDMQGTSHLDKKGRAQHLERLDSRYGFGSFIGGDDGRVHIGIEKTPLVLKPRAKTTWLRQQMSLFRKRSGVPSKGYRS